MPKKEYSYAELKGIIRVDDVVSAVPGKRNICFKLENNGSNTAKITIVDDERFWIDGCSHGYTEDGFLYLHTTEITWDTLKAGDVLENIHGDFMCVLGVIDNLVFIGLYSRKPIVTPEVTNQKGSFYFTKQYLQSQGFTIVQPDGVRPKTTLTKAEIENRLGLNEGSLVIEG